MEAIEMGAARVIRPELFFTTEVAGIAVPRVMISDGIPFIDLVHYLQWADGRREVREIADSIELAGGERLWVYPDPTEPEFARVAKYVGWSVESRSQWLLAEMPEAGVESVFRNIRDAINEFIEFPEDAAEATASVISLWVLLTYVYPAWDAVPWARGSPASSKSSNDWSFGPCSHQT